MARLSWLLISFFAAGPDVCCSGLPLMSSGAGSFSFWTDPLSPQRSTRPPTASFEKIFHTIGPSFKLVPRFPQNIGDSYKMCALTFLQILDFALEWRPSADPVGLSAVTLPSSLPRKVFPPDFSAMTFSLSVSAFWIVSFLR